MNRILVGLIQVKADQIVNTMKEITQSILAEEVKQALKQSGRLAYDGDLTEQVDPDMGT